MNKDLSDKLYKIVDKSIKILKGLDVSGSNSKISPGKWMTQEIIGHLIDSAANNRQRFVILQYDPEQSFIRYDQDKWVDIQDYRNADWDTLIDFWVLYNRLIAGIISKIPEETLKMTVKDGEKLTFREADRGIDLEYLIEDYIIHLKHHLGKLIDI
ncbi:hypothetical protein ACFL6G_00750 [candidate division KSB1 bacterium]